MMHGIRKLIALFIITGILCCAVPVMSLAESTAVENDIDALALSEKYDGRQHGINSPVHDQGNSNLCWAYSVIHASEASILRSGLSSSVSLSPTQLGYARHYRGADPLRNNAGESTGSAWQTTPGNPSNAVSVLSQWCGPTPGNSLYNVDGYLNRTYLMTEAINFDGSMMNTDTDLRLDIKRAIVQYGAVTFGFNYVADLPYLNPMKAAGSYPHACAIIGWDDTIPKESFRPAAATQDGGWLIKNSYRNNEYFYLTYDCTQNQVYALSYSSAEDYDYNYFYDTEASNYALSALQKIKQACNVFEAKGEANDGQAEVLKAVNVGLAGENITCTVNVYTNVTDRLKPTEGTLAATKTVDFQNSGYRLITLDNPVELQKGEDFSVEVQIVGDDSDYILMSNREVFGKTNVSFYGRNSSWTAVDTGGAAMRVKAFTALADRNEAPEPTTEPTTEPVTESPTAPPTEPATEPASEPVTEPVIEPDEPEGILGDADGNGIVNSSDATLILQYFSGIITAENINLTFADTDGDEGVTGADAVIVLQFYARIIPEFPKVNFYRRIY